MCGCAARSCRATAFRLMCQEKRVFYCVGGLCVGAQYRARGSIESGGRDFPEIE